MNLSRLCLIALAAAALAGCGNKGPLVLPSPTDAEPVTEPAAEPAGTDASGEAAGAEPPIEPETPTEAPAEVAPPAEDTPPPATDDGNGNG